MPKSNLSAFSHVAGEQSSFPTNQPASPTQTDGRENREEEALRIVKKNMYWSMGIGLIPIPWLDALGTGGLQAKALKELSDLYEIPFHEHKAKNLIASLISGLGTPYLASLFFGAAFFFVPVLGPLAYLGAMPLTAGALTYATGKVFIQHFESGGTFLDFNPRKVREYYRNQFKNGLHLSSQIKREQNSNT